MPNIGMAAQLSMPHRDNTTIHPRNPTHAQTHACARGKHIHTLLTVKLDGHSLSIEETELPETTRGYCAGYSTLFMGCCLFILV